MANTFAPNGFQQYQGTGSSPTYEQTQLAISSSNTNPIYFGDPITQAASATGIGTGYVTQGYGPVTLTVAATAITTNSTTGALTVTFTAATPTGGALPTSPNTWAPPVGSTLIIQSATMSSGNLNGTFLVTSSTTGTAVCGNAGATINATSTASGTCTIIVPIAGVFVGCRYLSTANKYPVWRNYWPGSDANGDVTAYAITDPNAQFSVMTGNTGGTATQVGFAAIGQNIAFAYSQSGVTTTNGVAASGLSTMFADQYTLQSGSGAAAGNNSGFAWTQSQAANPYLPFRILALANYVPGAVSPLVSINGNDNTTAYNRIVVAFNNSMPRQFAGI
jgi:hypothetical protein